MYREKRPYKPVSAKQAWITAFLVAGEFGVAVFLIIHDGHFMALYLAITYAMRDTEGGRQHHKMVAQMFHICIDCFKRKKKEHSDVDGE